MHRADMTVWYHKQTEDYFHDRVKAKIAALKSAPGETVIALVVDARRKHNMVTFFTNVNGRQRPWIIDLTIESAPSQKYV